jgi:hypothetical protein
MSRTIYANSDHSPWETNSAGIQLLYLLHEALDLPCEECSYPCEMSSKEALDTGNKLSEIDTKELLRVLILEIPEKTRKQLWCEGLTELLNWIREWQLFLLNSDGYHHENDCDENCP